LRAVKILRSNVIAKVQ